MVGRVDSASVPARREEYVHLDLSTRPTVGNEVAAIFKTGVTLAVARPVRVREGATGDHPEVRAKRHCAAVLDRSVAVVEDRTFWLHEPSVGGDERRYPVARCIARVRARATAVTHRLVRRRRVG